MSGIEKTPLRIPDAWFASWFRTFVVEYMAKADVRNAIGVGIEITSVGNSVATLTVSGAAGSAAIEQHNNDPMANQNAFALHNSDANANMAAFNAHAWPVHCVYITKSVDNPATLLGYGTWVELEGGPGWAESHAWERTA